MTPAEARFERLAAECGPRVLAHLRLRVEPRDEAADVFQRVLTTTWRRIHVVPEDDDHALAWMFTVARNEVANHRRVGQRRLAATERLAAALATGVVEGGPLPDAVEHVRTALDLLGEQDRDVIVLTYWDGLSSDQVAVVLGISGSAARKRLQRARTRLAAALSDSPVTVGTP